MNSEYNRIVSGVQPSGSLTLGNYLGALSTFAELCNKFELVLFVADLHSLTTGKHNAEELRENSSNIVKHYIASGVAPEKCHFFLQNQIPEHTELGYILLCNSTIGELSRMTQFKSKANIVQPNKTESVPTGLLIYPLLMAADILLYKPKFVPVGDDQSQHLELTRDLALRFNKKYGDVFTIPEAYINKTTSRIMDLQDPTKKMSKSSENKKGTIFLLDPIETSLKKIKASVTDSYNKIAYEKKNQPGISNLIDIYLGLKNSLLIKNHSEEYNLEQLLIQFKNKSYGDFKIELINLMKIFLEKYQKKFYQTNDNVVKNILDEGRKYCQKIAQTTLKEVKQKIGLWEI